jgi:FtsP/CotA-like multicopper oxidase with cupredoxin domain
VCKRINLAKAISEKETTMKKRTTLKIFRCLALGICLLTSGLGFAAQVDIYLRAGTTTQTMADGRTVLMWGFAKDSGPAVQDGTITVPGPALALGPDAQSLVIHLTNTLTTPVSIVIPGQYALQGNPVRNPDGRARSFTHEAPPGGTAVYTWPNLQPGTYLYHSGSHPALQVQMGLYGTLTRLVSFGEAYPGVRFEREMALLFSEVDPNLHDAVAADDYGPGKTVTSTLKYTPQYFFINGVSYTNGLLPVFAGSPGDRILVRFLNAGLDYRAPTLNGGYFSLLSEDGNLLPFPRETYTTLLPPLKTMDALFSVEASSPPQTFALYDRRLGLVNATDQGAGGMLTHLDVSTPVFPTDLPATWITNHFGPGPSYPPGTIGSLDDPDNDGVSNINEYISGTHPNDPQSYLRITALSPPDPLAGTVITFSDTAAGRLYNLESSTNLMAGGWDTVHTNVAGFAGAMWLNDPRPQVPARFYRIKLASP